MKALTRSFSPVFRATLGNVDTRVEEYTEVFLLVENESHAREILGRFFAQQINGSSLDDYRFDESSRASEALRPSISAAALLGSINVRAVLMIKTNDAFAKMFIVASEGDKVRIIRIKDREIVDEWELASLIESRF